MAVAGAISAAERSIRSVFVGNIPFDATEEKLKDLFSEVGPVISFRLVYDRDSGKPKGYGFCEYFDAETASSALRNLNGYELNGRAIRVDNAANERNREELKNFQMSTPVLSSESPYGAECSPDKAPEAISKAVASLPPEQMFELMKQMKHCIQNNPNEARNMLLQNPQLAYALLQAQVVMKIVDPQVALTMLHRPNTAIQPILQAGNVVEVVPAASVPTGTATAAITITKPAPNPISNVFPEALKGPTAVVVNPPPVPASGPRGPLPPQGEFIRGPANTGVGNPFMDPRAQQFEPRDPRNMHFDPRGGPGVRPPSMMRPPMMMPPPRELMRDPRDMNRGDPRAMPHDMDIRPPHFEPRLRGMDPRNIRGPPEFDQRSMGPMLRPRFPERGGFDPRSPIYVDQRDPRSQAVPSPVRPLGPPRTGGGGGPPLPSSQSPQQAGGGQDQEKAALIMQVLQLSDQQIALLPPEQRQSIMVLKEQIARSAENQK